MYYLPYQQKSKERTNLQMILLARGVAFLTFLLFTLGFTPASQAKTLKIGVNAIGENFDYRYTLDANSYWVIKLLSTGLLKNVKEDTAAAFVISRTATSYTFKIKEMYFTNGDRLNAYDIKLMYDDLLNNPKTTVYKNTLQNIKQVEVLDQERVKFHFEKTDNFPNAKFTVPIFKKTEEGLVGLGPYVIEDFKFPYKLVLKSIDDTLYYDEIEFIPNSLPVVRVIKLMKGEVDALQGGLQTLQINWLKEKDFDVQAQPGSNYAYLGFNMKDKDVGNVAIRKAIAYGINVDDIVKYLYLGYAEKAGSLLNPGYFAYKANYIKQDKEKAIKLLDDAGYKPNKDGVRVTIDFSVSNNNQSLIFAQILQSQLKDVGINLNIVISDWGRFYNDIRSGNVQMYALAWVGIFDGDIFKDLFHTDSMNDGGLNRSFYSNKKLDKLADKVVNDKLTEQELRDTLFAIQDIQYNDMIYVPLWKKHNVLITKPGLKTYTPSLDGGFEGIKNIKKEEE